MNCPISVIVPVGPNEAGLQYLVSNLNGLPADCEVILACSETSETLNNIKPPNHLRLNIIHQGQGRASQMNAGAMAAGGDWLWFLHADSVFETGVLERLAEIASQNFSALYYHDLKFLADGPSGMALNEWAVGGRSNIFKMPFGDQGFFIKQELFHELGKYREDLAYGEDHVFVWKARQEGVEVISTGTKLATSARKYKKHGWLKTTLLHVRLTFAQAIPQFLILLKRQALGTGK